MRLRASTRPTGQASRQLARKGSPYLVACSLSQGGSYGPGAYAYPWHAAQNGLSVGGSACLISTLAHRDRWQLGCEFPTHAAKSQLL